MVNLDEISINQIMSGGFDYKEKCPHKRSLVMESLKRYGQLQPLIGFWIDKENFLLIKGHTVLSCLVELKVDFVLVNDIGQTSEEDCIAIRNSLDESVNDIDVLKFALLLEKVRYSGGITDQEIATKLQIRLQQVMALKDLLKLDYTINIRQVKTQHSFDFDQETNHELNDK